MTWRSWKPRTLGQLAFEAVQDEFPEWTMRNWTELKPSEHERWKRVAAAISKGKKKHDAGGPKETRQMESPTEESG